MNNFIALLKQADFGHMPATAYDTAWIARLGEVDFEISNVALGWLTEHQLQDGSWGTSYPYYYHDRIICTLAAINTLSRYGRRNRDRKQIDRGLAALERISNEFSQSLSDSGNGDTVGFELIAPTLLSEAESMGILTHQSDRFLGHLYVKRSHKLAALKGQKINRYMSFAFSSEMAGTDMKTLLDVENLPESNGSIGHSPSASAYYALHVCKGDEPALCYLHQVLTPDGGVPNLAPFDIFERVWILWNLSLTAPLSTEMTAACQPHLNFLENSWIPGEGIGLAAGYTPKDSDDTGLVYEVLTRFGRKVDLETLFTYEEEDCFRCLQYEANRSVCANIHILGALRQAGFPADHPTIQKIARFLQQTQHPSGYFLDKWNASPYYASAHAVIICAGYLPELVKKTVQWFLDTQDKNGAWGFGSPTAEETAFSLQALCTWKKYGYDVPQKSIDAGAIWLDDHREPPYPALWIGKCLYMPELIVRSAILSALELANRGG